MKEFMQRILVFTCIFTNTFCFGQFEKQIDSLIGTHSNKPFNGVILIAKGNQILYSSVKGLSDLENQTPLKSSDHFVIGSISKQISAVLVLREYDKGRIQLHVPIRQYLPNLTQTWADTVTIHQLLTHTHGITKLNAPLAFKAGTQYAYSQLGFQLLSEIIEKTSKKSFAELSAELFAFCGMTNTFHPDLKKHHLVKGYTEQVDGKPKFEEASLENYVAAGSFISTAPDLLRWNRFLQNGKLLKRSTYKMMISKQKNATRQHPLFGVTDYGYGITVDTKDNILQLGQTGFAPGFISMDFYFPKNKVSLIILGNVVWDEDDLKKVFYFHTGILKIVREHVAIEVVN